MASKVPRMNTIELFYQIFRARYSLDAVRQSLGKTYRLALLGGPEEVQRLQGWLGEATLASGAVPEEAPVVISTPLTEQSTQELQSVDAAIYHLGSQNLEDPALRQQAEWLPPGVATLWLYEAPPAEGAAAPSQDPTLPRVHRVDPARAGEQVPRLVLTTFPDLSIRLARDFSRVRLECARRLTSRTAARMAMVAAASSVTVSVPLVGQLLSLVAVTGETMVITASQLRLALLMGALYGRPLDFFDRVDELWPVVGGALGWRTLARQLVGFIPVAGPVAKAAIAWSGTWIVGESCRLFYELGEHLPDHVKKQVEEEARRRAGEEAARYVKGLREGFREGRVGWPADEDKWFEEAVEAPSEPPVEGPAQASPEPDPGSEEPKG